MTSSSEDELHLFPQSMCVVTSVSQWWKCRLRNVSLGDFISMQIPQSVHTRTTMSLMSAPDTILWGRIVCHYQNIAWHVTTWSHHSNTLCWTFFFLTLCHKWESLEHKFFWLQKHVRAFYVNSSHLCTVLMRRCRFSYTKQKEIVSSI